LALWHNKNLLRLSHSVPVSPTDHPEQQCSALTIVNRLIVFDIDLFKTLENKENHLYLFGRLYNPYVESYR